MYSSQKGLFGCTGRGAFTVAGTHSADISKRLPVRLHTILGRQTQSRNDEESLNENHVDERDGFARLSGLGI